MVSSGGSLGTGFAWKDGSFPGTGGTCTAMLASAAACTVVVTFTPGTASPIYGQVRVSYSDGTTTSTAVRNVSAASGL
jgi:hypothetical protein